MGLLGSAVLVNWGGIVEEKEIEYNEWHSKEHMPERMCLPGFLRGLRAVGIPGTNINHKYCCFASTSSNCTLVYLFRYILDLTLCKNFWTKLFLVI